jgi:hypothetical protein
MFWLFIFFFAIIGALRGWAKELLVIFSLLLALFLNDIIEKFVPGFSGALSAQDAKIQFWVRMSFFSALAFFGYQTPNLSSFVGSKAAARDRLQSFLLGFFMGGINGWLFIGTLWYYLHFLNYPFDGMSPPADLASVEKYIQYLPPLFVSSPSIYFAVGIAFVFVIIVFI